MFLKKSFGKSNREGICVPTTPMKKAFINVFVSHFETYYQ